jgi:hypothetical protein
VERPRLARALNKEFVDELERGNRTKELAPSCLVDALIEEAHIICLGLARRVGVTSLELEAKAPGLSSRAFQVFGDDAGKAIARTVPREDMPRLLKYGELADSPKTRQMLLGAYEKEGRSLFERVPPKIVLASGLSAAMLLGTYEVTAPDRALAKSIEDNPDMAKAILSQKVAWSALLTILVVGILLWRFGLMPWHRKAIRATSGKKLRSA